MGSWDQTPWPIDECRRLHRTPLLGSGELPVMLILAGTIGLVVGLPGRGVEAALLAILATCVAFVIAVRLVDHLRRSGNRTLVFGR